MRDWKGDEIAEGYRVIHVLKGSTRAYVSIGHVVEMRTDPDPYGRGEEQVRIRWSVNQKGRTPGDISKWIFIRHVTVI